MKIAPRQQRQGFFVVGGTMRYDAPSYVERPADKELPALIRAGRFTYVLTARQMGKSSLINRTAYHLQQEGVQTALIDLTRLGSSSSEEEWYLALLEMLSRQLRLTVELNAWWDGQRVGMVPRFIGFLEDVVLCECQGTVVIFVDEIDVTLNLPFSDDFFAAIRALYNARAQNPIFDRLTFVLAGVASPTDLIKEHKRTPFNVGEALLLQDFSRADAQRLQIGLEQASLSQAEHLFSHIYQWTDGHPYLTQKLCQALIEQQQQQTCTTNEIDELVKRLFLADRSLKEDNLKFVQDKLLSHPQQRQLLLLYRQIYRGKELPDDPQSLLQTQLKLSGLVKTEHGHLKVRNEIYRQVFDLAWIKAHTAIDWVRMVAGVAVLLVVLLVGVLAQSTWAGMRDRDIRAEFHETNTTATQKIELLHELFGLRAYIPAQDYSKQAQETFHGLPRAKQVDLFRHYSGEEQPLFAVVDEFSPTLADVQGDGSTQPILEAMYDAIKEKTETKQEKALKEQLHDWWAAQEDFHDGKRQEALAHYNDAFERTPDKPNPAILFERARARLLAQSGQDEEALQDLERVLAIAENEKSHLSDDATPTATLSPTWTPEPSATPTIANTPTASSPPTATEEGGNETFPDAPILPEPIAPLPTEPPLPPNSAQFYSADTMRRAVSEFILDNQDNQRLIKLLNDAPDSQYPFLRSVITLPYPVVLAGTPIPQPIEAIWAENAALITRLRGWGQEVLTEVEVVYSPDGNQLAIATLLGIYLVELQTLKYSHLTLTDNLLSMAFSADGKLLASGSYDGEVHLWRVSDGQLLNTLANHSGAVSSVAFSADGKLLASGSFAEVRLWQVSEGQLLDTLEGHFVTVSSVAFSADGKLLASGSDGQVRLWRVSNGQLLNTLEVYSIGMSIVAFSPDGKLLASGFTDGRLLLWRVSDRQLLNTLANHSNSVTSIAFSADGKLLASGSQDSTVRLWRVSDGQLLNTLEGHSGTVLSVAFSADGQLLASCSGDGTIRLWGVRP